VIPRRLVSHRWLAAAILVSAMPAGSRPAHAQTVQGTITDENSHRPLQLAEIRLVRRDLSIARTAVSDSTGRYRISPPEPGAYHVEADLLGYQSLHSPLLALDEDKTYTADFELPVDPIELEGMQVEVEAIEAIRRELRSYGVRVNELGERFVDAGDIARRAGAMDFARILQWQMIPGMQVIRSEDAAQPDVKQTVCIQVVPRNAGCALLVLDGALITSQAAAELPTTNLRAMAVLRPEEATLLYGTDAWAGAVLLFTR